MTNEGLRPASDFADAVWHEMTRPRLVTIENGCFNVHDPAQYGSVYSIEIDRCTERDDILRWFRQLSEKTWVNVHVLEDFSKALIHHFGVQG